MALTKAQIGRRAGFHNVPVALECGCGATYEDGSGLGFGSYYNCPEHGHVRVVEIADENFLGAYIDDMVDAELARQDEAARFILPGVPVQLLSAAGVKRIADGAHWLGVVAEECGDWRYPDDVVRAGEVVKLVRLLEDGREIVTRMILIEPY